MTLYLTTPGYPGIVFNFFVIDNEKEGYHFNGVTLTPQGDYIPNNFLQNRYHALGSNEGIGVTPECITYFAGGQVALTIRDNFSDLLSSPPDWQTEKRRASFHPRAQMGPTSWICIKNRLSKLADTSHDAKSLLAIMEEWENASFFTLFRAQHVIQDKCPQALGGTVEIHVAGDQWLWYGHRSGLFVIGYKDALWGSVFLFAGPNTPLGLVSPVSNGWFVIREFPNKGYAEHLLLYQVGQEVQADPVLFPTGEWETTKGYTIWRHELLELPPGGKLCLAPFPPGIISAAKKRGFEDL